MKAHILNGDALATTFKRANIDGDVIVNRECLIQGPVSKEGLEAFWEDRAEYLSTTFSEPKERYYQSVKGEFDKIDQVNNDDEVFLWFENDLFCQVNLWFTISLLNEKQISKAYRVCPLIRSEKNWEGFGRHTPTDLAVCFSRQVPFTKGDFKLGANLWNAYRKEDIVALAFHAKSLSPCFPFLDEVCRAEVERKIDARPQKALEDIMSKGYTNFNDIFTQFSKREGIYGFGDLQVDEMLKSLRV